MVDMYIVSLRCGKSQAQGLDIQFYQLYKLMKNNERKEVEKLFTFGEDQLNQCLKENNKKRFPFMKNGKMRKLSALHKIVSQQRSTLHQSESTIQKGTLLSRQLPQKVAVRKMVEFAFEGNRFIQNINMNGRQQESNKKGKKLSLPKVFKESFSSGKRDLNRKRVPSSDKSVRYQNNDQKIVMVRPFASQEYEKSKCGIYSGNKPKSLMLLSSLVCELPEQKMRGIQSSKEGNFRRTKKSKSTRGSQVVTLDPQISQNIRKLKRIYH